MFSREHSNSAEKSELRRLLIKALTEYPPYTPPLWDPDTQSLREANVEYQRFFSDNRARRLTALCEFLAHFQITVSLEDAGVMGVSAWCPLFAGLLVDGLETDHIYYVFHGFQAPWSGPLIGLNPIFDLAIYFGECLLLRRPRMTWKPVRGPEIAAHPIFGRKVGTPFDPMKWMYTTCKTWASLSDEGQCPVPPIHAAFIKRDYLYRSIHAQTIT